MRTIRPLRDIARASPLAAMSGADAHDATRHVFDMVDMAVVVSCEMMWPTLLKLARGLRDGAVEQGGWRLRAEPSRKNLDTLFVLEEICGSGGYLFNLRLRPRRTEAALSMLDKVTAGVEEEIAALKDAEARLKRRYDALMDPSTEVVAIDSDPASYVSDYQCQDVEYFSCCAFSPDDILPFGYDREGFTPHTIEVAATLGPDATNQMPGMVFAFQPSWLVEMGDDPEVPVLRTVADAGATVVVLERLSAMLEAAGLSDEVRSRDAQLGHIAYTHYGLRSNSEVMEVAASAVYRDGGLFGAACTRAVSQAFSIACNRIVGENSVPIGTAIRLMREAGHVDEDSAYDECGDSIHVAETGEGHGVMSVVTSHHRYRLEYDLDEDGIVGRLRLSIVDEPDGLDPMSGEHSFLGSYALSPDGHVTARPDDENGFHGGKVIRSLNDLTLSVSLAAEQIQQIGRTRLSR